MFFGYAKKLYVGMLKYGIMRICKNCGEKESPIWRNRMYHLYTQYCRIDELKEWEPEIAEKLVASTEVRKMGRQEIKFYSDGFYNYGLRQDGFVIRIYKLDARDPDSLKEPEHETPDHMKKRKIEDMQKQIDEWKRIVACKTCQVTSCFVCELHGRISNMEREDGKFVCKTCGTVIFIK